MRAALFALLFCASLWADAKIFCYHRFDDQKHKTNPMNLDTKLLRQQFELFRKEGYRVVKLSEVLSSVNSGKKMGEKLVAITVDDAYKSFYKNGLPLLKEFGYPFTLFVYVEGVDKKWPDFMSWEEIRQTKKYGDVQLHSYGHRDLTKMSASQIVADTNSAVDIFQKQMGYRPTQYAYPFGAYDNRVIESLKPFGFEALFAVNGGAVDGYSDRYAIDRIAVSPKVQVEKELENRLLDIVWDKAKFYDTNGSSARIRGTIKDFNSSHIRVRVQNNGWCDVGVKDGRFEMNLPLAANGTTPKLRFQAADNRFVIKTIVRE